MRKGTDAVQNGKSRVTRPPLSSPAYGPDDSVGPGPNPYTVCTNNAEVNKPRQAPSSSSPRFRAAYSERLVGCLNVGCRFARGPDMLYYPALRWRWA
jgi:hypothetical protein